MILEARDISKEIKGNNIISNFSIEVKKKDFIVILGESGAGKTTLINLLSLMLPVSDGQIFYHDSLVNSKKEKRILKRLSIGYIFQNYGLLENNTVLQNLKLATKYSSGFSKEHLLKKIELLHLEENILNKKVRELSGGEQQRVALLRTILKPFEVIFADEPTGNLDVDNSNIIMEHLKSLTSSDDKAVVVVTHNLKFAELATQVIKL